MEFAVRVANELDNTVLAIQGPPGAGKTFTGARMICALVQQGKRVGVTAISHKVIRKLLDDTAKMAAEERHRDQTGAEGRRETGRRKSAAEWPRSKTTGRRCSFLKTGLPMSSAERPGCGRDRVRSAVDVLFVDEAGQMSLANVLAVAQAAGSIVLLGDPQQLEQPKKGSHPEGVNAPPSSTFLVSTRLFRPIAEYSCRSPGGCSPYLCVYVRAVLRRPLDIQARPGTSAAQRRPIPRKRIVGRRGGSRWKPKRF